MVGDDADPRSAAKELIGGRNTLLLTQK
jgi:hypothetical protein